MKMRALLLMGLAAAAVSVSAPTPAGAADEEGRFALRGVGLATCDQFLQAIEERQENVLLAGGWLEGYLTAVNQFRSDTFDIAPWQNTDTLLTLLKHNCERNREQRFFAVVNSMVDFFAGKRLEQQAERVVAEAGEQQLVLYKDVLADAQQALIDQGLLQGNADGQFGPQTKTAFEEFQKKQGIEVTGLPDQMTLWRLLSESAPPGGAPPSGG